MSDDLIARLSAGGRWDGDNAEVLKALGWTFAPMKVTQNYVGTAGQIDPAHWIDASGQRHEVCRPLDSVDDALRLVPEGWRTDSAYEYESLWEWQLENLETGALVYAKAPTAAIALTIAILEASRG